MLSLMGELWAGGLLCGGGMRMEVLGGEMDRDPVVPAVEPGVCAGVGVGDACGMFSGLGIAVPTAFCGVTPALDIA